MSRSRRNWVAIALVVTCLTTAALGVATLAGFGAAPSGDVMLSASATSTDLLVAVAALALLGLDLAHGRARNKPVHAGAGRER